MKIVLMTLFALALIVTGSTSTRAQNVSTKAGNWELLGSHVVDYTLDHDVVDLKNTTETYTSLKIVVKQGAVNVHKATVHFASGSNQDIDLSNNLNASNDGQVIDLKGNDRVINKVTFWYNTKTKSESKGIVEVWGKK